MGHKLMPPAPCAKMLPLFYGHPKYDSSDSHFGVTSHALQIKF